MAFGTRPPFPLPRGFLGGGDAAPFPRVSDEGWAFYTSTSSVTPSMPTHAAGDLLVAFFYIENDPTITHPSGWTTQGTSRVTSTRASYVDYKVAASASEAPSWSWTGNYEGFVQIVVFEAGTFDAGTPLGTTQFDQGASTWTAGSDAFPDRGTVGSVNETIIYQANHGDDLGTYYFTGTPAPPAQGSAHDWGGHLPWANGTATGADGGSYGSYLYASAGASITGQNFYYNTSHTRGYMLVVQPVRGGTTAVAAIDGFAGSGTGTYPDPDIWVRYERQDSTSWAELNNNRLHLETKYVINRISAFVRYHLEMGGSNYEITFDYIADGTCERELEVHLMGSGGFDSIGADRPTTAGSANTVKDSVGFRLRASSADVFTTDSSGTITSEGTSDNPGMSGAQTWHVRARLEDGLIQVRYWLDGGSEPGTWDLEEGVSPATVGYLMFVDHQRSSGLNNANRYIDNFTYMYLGAASNDKLLEATVGGAASVTSTLQQHSLLSGSIANEAVVVGELDSVGWSPTAGATAAGQATVTGQLYFDVDPGGFEIPYNLTLGSSIAHIVDLGPVELGPRGHTFVEASLDVPFGVTVAGEATVTATLWDMGVTATASGLSAVTGWLWNKATANTVELSGTIAGQATATGGWFLVWDRPQTGQQFFYQYTSIGVGFDPIDDGSALTGFVSQTYPDGAAIDEERYLFEYVNIGVAYDDTDDISGRSDFVSQNYPDGNIITDWDRYYYLYTHIYSLGSRCSKSLVFRPGWSPEKKPIPKPPRGS